MDEPELLREIEEAVVKLWMWYPAARGKMLIGYGDYSHEPEGVAKGENFNARLHLPNEFQNGAYRLPAAHNTLGRAIVQYELVDSLDQLNRIEGFEPSSIENYEQMAQSEPSQAFLLVQINDAYTWPGYNREKTPQDVYSQDELGTMRGSGGFSAEEGVDYITNDFPNLLLTILKEILRDNQGDYVEVTTGSERNKNYAFAFDIMGHMSDRLLRGLIRVGARDFQMAKRWLIKVNPEEAHYNSLMKKR